MEEKRTIHGITFKDDLAWMESMKGVKWNSFLETEKKEFYSLLKKSNTEKIIPLLISEIQSASATSTSPLLQSGNVQIAIKGTMNYSWNWPDCPAYNAAALCVKGDSIWTIEDIGEGAEVYCVRYRVRGSHEVIWEFKGVGPFVSVIGDRCYCIESKNTLIYWKLVSWKSKDGSDYRIHYEENDYRYNLELSGCFLRRQAGSKQDIFSILPDGKVCVLEGISLESRRFIFDCSSDNYLEVKNEFNIESFHSKQNLYVSKSKGIRTLWRGDKIIWKGVGQVLLDPFGGPWVRFTQPGHNAVWWDSSTNTYPPKAHIIQYHLTQKRKIPYCIVYPRNHMNIKNLLIIGYGAYGIPTPMSTSRWEPLLQRGWAVVIGLWRGGGDDTAEWEDLGRCKGREDVLYDAEDVVRDVQKRLHVKARDTVLYGRSAGGLWVGGLIARYPDKDNIAGGCYMEVPYLDVLRTTTNRALPLTDIETDEFGLPEQRLSDLASILKWSPMEQLIGKAPTSFQLVRTGANDSEVFAYESAKWVKRSCVSGDTRRAWLALENGQGHFVSGDKGVEQQAKDIGILLYLTNNKKSKYYV